MGKTTLVRRVAERLREEGYRLAGFYCPEVRRGGRRVGFRIMSLDGRHEAWLARVDGCSGPRVGRYNTCREAEEVASRAAEEASQADLVVIDEIGPMELKLPGIRGSILSILRSGKPGLFVVHERLSDREVLPQLQQRGRWFRVTLENRDSLVDEVYRFVKSIVHAVRASRGPAVN